MTGMRQPWPWGDPKGDLRGRTIDSYTDDELKATIRGGDLAAANSARARIAENPTREPCAVCDALNSGSDVTLPDWVEEPPAAEDPGWILRNAIIWTKVNAMPESVADRLSTTYEHIFLITRSPKYWFNLDSIRVAQSPASVARATRADMRTKPGWADAYHGNPPTGLANSAARDTTIGANPGDVWSIPTVPFAGAHFATYPPELGRRCITAGCKPGGTVLDPFHGSGTTGKVAVAHGHKYVGIELNKEYLDLSLETRLANGTLNFDEVLDA